jgi:transposase, IS5 family
MLIDRYDPLNLFERIPSLGMQMDPVLAQLDRLLDHDEIFQAVKADLAKRYPQTLTVGRHSTPVEVILRMLVIKHLYGWSFEETEHFVADSLVLRQTCRVYAEHVPDDTTLIRWATLIQPATLQTLLEHVTALARQLKVTNGRKLRIDGTVVETNIHHPSDSTLLNDGVRVLSRVMRKMRRAAADTVGWSQEQLEDAATAAKAGMKRIMDVARQKGEPAADALKTAYRDLVDLTQTVVAQAQHTVDALTTTANAVAHQYPDRLEELVPRVEQVIQQTTRRVLQGEKVPAPEKIVSLFEPHTAILRKGKPGKPVEFGRMLWLDEVEGGIITRYQILVGNPDEAAQVVPSVDAHIARFGHPPELVAGDRGLQSAANERDLAQRKVAQIVLPKPGKKSAKRLAHERQDWFVAGHNWRAGIEGRISGLKRRHKLNRCRYHGDAGMHRWVGFGLLAHDLRMIARAIT